MKAKTLLLLLSILLSGLLILWIKIYLPNINPKISEYEILLKGVNAGTLNSIKITKNKITLSMIKTDDDWKINDKLVNKTRIGEFISSLLSVSNSMLVAESDKKYKDLQLTDELSTKVQLNDISLLFGRSSPDGIFLRFADNDKIFLLQEFNIDFLATDSARWYNDGTVSASPK